MSRCQLEAAYGGNVTAACAGGVQVGPSPSAPRWPLVFSLAGVMHTCENLALPSL